MFIGWIGFVGIIGAYLIANQGFYNFEAVSLPRLSPRWSKVQGSMDGLYFFASSSDSGEKTEKASSKKLEDSRKKGQVPKSADLNNFVSLIGAFGLLLFFGPTLLEMGQKKMAYYLGNSYRQDLLSNPQTLFMEAVLLFLNVMLMVLIPMLVFGIAGNIVQTGFLFTTDTLKPKFSKLNPVNGFKEMFSRKRWFDLIKNLAKLSLVSFVSYQFVKGQEPILLKLPYLNLVESLSVLGEMVQSLLIQIIMAVGAIGAIDFAFQRYDYSRNLKMTKQEVKEEYKQMEGDPYIKGLRRQRQREISQGRMMAAVPEATVIITNPTHFAVAIQYNHETDVVPKVIAKGLDLKALKIKEIAKEHEVPIIENKPLARSLYKLVDVDQEIPMELYKGVSEVLVLIYRLEEKKKKRYRY